MPFSTHDELQRTEPDHVAEELRAPQSSGQVWGGLVAGAGTVLGIGSLFYKPLLFGTFAVLFVVLGSLSEEGGRMAKVSVPLVCTCVVLGMCLCIFVTHKPAW